MGDGLDEKSKIRVENDSKQLGRWVFDELKKTMGRKVWQKKKMESLVQHMLNLRCY